MIENDNPKEDVTEGQNQVANKQEQVIPHIKTIPTQITLTISATAIALALNACAPTYKSLIPQKTSNSTPQTPKQNPQNSTIPPGPGKIVEDLEKQVTSESSKILNLIVSIDSYSPEQTKKKLPEIMKKSEEIVEGGMLYHLAITALILLGNQRKIPAALKESYMQTVMQNELIIVQKDFKEFADTITKDISSHPKQNIPASPGKKGKKSKNRRIAELMRSTSQTLNHQEFSDMIGNYNPALYNALLPYVLIGLYFKSSILPNYKHDDHSSFLDLFRDFSTNPNKHWKQGEKRPAKCHNLTILASSLLPVAKEALLKQGLTTKKPSKMGTAKTAVSMTASQQLAPGFASSTEHIFLAVTLNGHSPKDPKKPHTFYFEPTVGDIIPWKNLENDMDQGTKPRPMKHLIGSLFNEIGGTYLSEVLTNTSLSEKEKKQLIQKSLKYYKIATILDDKNHISWINLGTSQLLNNQLDQAKTSYNQAKSLNSKDYPMPEFGLAQVQYLKKNFPQAEKDSLELINVIKTDIRQQGARAQVQSDTLKQVQIQTYALLARAQMQQSKYGNAQASIKALLKLSPNNPEITKLRTELSYLMKGTNTKQLEKEASAIFQQKKYAMALIKYAALHKLAPNETSYIQNIAVCYEQINDLPNAIQYYQLSLTKKPDPQIKQEIERCQRILATNHYNKAVKIYNVMIKKPAKTSKNQPQLAVQVKFWLSKSNKLLQECKDPRCNTIRQYTNQLAKDTHRHLKTLNRSKK